MQKRIEIAKINLSDNVNKIVKCKILYEFVLHEIKTNNFVMNFAGISRLNIYFI